MSVKIMNELNCLEAWREVWRRFLCIPPMSLLTSLRTRVQWLSCGKYWRHMISHMSRYCCLESFTHSLPYQNAICQAAYVVYMTPGAVPPMYILANYFSCSFLNETSPENCRTRHYGVFDLAVRKFKTWGTEMTSIADCKDFRNRVFPSVEVEKANGDVTRENALNT